MKKAIKKLTKEFLKEMGFADAKIDVVQEEELFKINIESGEDRASPEAMQAERRMLIGYHGETISALQLLLSLFIYHQEEKWVKILVNVGDYRKKREEQLKELAQKAAQRVKFSGRPVSLSGLSSFERRAVHLVLKDDPEVESFSEGEGKWRVLVVAPKQETEKKEIAKEN